MGEKTEAQKRAQAKYMQKFYVARVRLPIEEHERLTEYMQHSNDSLNTFIRKAITEKIDRDSKTSK